MYVVGGAAIALSFDTGRSTKDIDATMIPEDAVLEAAGAVARAEHLPPDWLNSETSWNMSMAAMPTCSPGAAR
jgi:hypothetical protein